MITVIKPRGDGKTCALIMRAVAGNCDILVANARIASCVLDTAVWLGVPGRVLRTRSRGPISVGALRILIPEDILRPRDGIRREQKPILIDDIDLVLPRLLPFPVAGFSLREEATL